MSTDLVSMLMVAAGFVLVIIAMIFPKFARRRTGGEMASSSAARQAELRSLERVEERLLELEETSRDIFGRLDTRGRMMIRMIEEAEIKCQQLEHMIARKRGEA